MQRQRPQRNSRPVRGNDVFYGFQMIHAKRLARRTPNGMTHWTQDGLGGGREKLAVFLEALQFGPDQREQLFFQRFIGQLIGPPPFAYFGLSGFERFGHQGRNDRFLRFEIIEERAGRDAGCSGDAARRRVFPAFGREESGGGFDDSIPGFGLGFCGDSHNMSVLIKYPAVDTVVNRKMSMLILVAVI